MNSKFLKSKRNLVLYPLTQKKLDSQEYIFILKQQGFSAKRINNVFFEARCEGLNVFFSKNNFIKKILSESELNGCLFMITTDDLFRGLQFIRTVLKPEYDFYKRKDLIEEDHIIAPIVTNLKAGQVLSLFQKKMKVKVNRGNLEITEPYKLKKGQLVDSDLENILNLMNLKLKKKQIQLLRIHRKKRPFDKQKTEFLIDEGQKETDLLVSTLKTLSQTTLACGFELRLDNISLLKNYEAF